VPETAALAMSPLIVSSRIERESKYKGQNKPFLTPAYQILPAPRHDFAANETLYLFFQVRGLTAELQDTGALVYDLSSETGKVRSFVKAVKDYGSSLDFLEEISLADLPPANYEIKVSLQDGTGAAALSEQTYFYITHRPAVPRPWVLALTKPPDDDPEILNPLGVQALNKGDVAGARAYLEQAYKRNPSSPQLAMDYCRVLLKLSDFAAVKRVAQPLAGAGRFEFYELLGKASQALGELAEAVGYYKEYVNRMGTSIEVLNSIGDCYAALGDSVNALVAWGKSLELNPNQESVRARAQAIKAKQ
jgi:tetratricopeptide (TPR) repeat protein